VFERVDATRERVGAHPLFVALVAETAELLTEPEVVDATRRKLLRESLA
jgi:hypothetical protein